MINIAKEMGKRDWGNARAVAGISLIKDIYLNIKDIQGKIIEIGESYYSKDQIVRDVNHISSVMFTPSDPIANTLLATKINKLKYEINDLWRDPKLIQKCLREVEQAFLLAVAKHFQVNDKIILSTVVKALGNESILDDPHIRFLDDKKPDKDKDEDNI